MLKMNASYSKKVPTEIDYSSQSFHASVEVELPDGLSELQLKQRIHDTFKLVKDSVETEIKNGNGNSNGNGQQERKENVSANGNGKTSGNGCSSATATQKNASEGNGNGQKPASSKQVKFLRDLADTMQVNLSDYLGKYNVKNVFELTSNECSKLIDTLKAMEAKA